YHFIPMLVALALFGTVEGWRSLRAGADAPPRTEMSDRRIEFQSDQGEAEGSVLAGRLAAGQHADANVANGADPGPDRIRRGESSNRNAIATNPKLWCAAM